MEGGRLPREKPSRGTGKTGERVSGEERERGGDGFWRRRQNSDEAAPRKGRPTSDDGYVQKLHKERERERERERELLEGKWNLFSIQK
jgi:hypothetical protein